MERWRRVHLPVSGATTLSALAGVAIFAASVLLYVSLIAGSDQAFAAAIYTAFGAIILIMWAMSAWAHGVFVGREGVRISYGLTTLVFGWSDIAGVEVRSDRLWVLTTANTAVETPVIRRKFCFGRTPPGRLYLAGPDFDAVLKDLAK